MSIYLKFIKLLSGQERSADLKLIPDKNDTAVIVQNYIVAKIKGSAFNVEETSADGKQEMNKRRSVRLSNELTQNLRLSIGGEKKLFTQHVQ